jgi:hypothetical protein
MVNIRIPALLVILSAILFIKIDGYRVYIYQEPSYLYVSQYQVYTTYPIYNTRRSKVKIQLYGQSDYDNHDDYYHNYVRSLGRSVEIPPNLRSSSGHQYVKARQTLYDEEDLHYRNNQHFSYLEFSHPGLTSFSGVEVSKNIIIRNDCGVKGVELYHHFHRLIMIMTRKLEEEGLEKTYLMRVTEV